MRALLAALILMIAAPAWGQERAIPAIVCDSQAQAERLIELLIAQTKDPIDTLNAEVKNPTACAILIIQIEHREQVYEKGGKAVSYFVYKVTVSGFHNGLGVTSVHPHYIGYTLGILLDRT